MSEVATMNGGRRPGVLLNAAGEVVATVTDAGGVERAAAPNGRLVVAPGQAIASAWGNTTYDQTVQTFASAADRANQWPAPNEGAVSFLVDSHTPWIWRSGGWRGLPIGYVGSANGPPASTDCGSTWTTLASASAPVVAGRRYVFAATVTGQQVSAAGLSQFRLMDDQGVTSAIGLQNSLPVSGYVVGSGSIMYLPSATKTAALAVQGQTSAGALRVAANNAYLHVHDIGG